MISQGFILIHYTQLADGLRRKVVVQRRKADSSEEERRSKDRMDYSIAQAKRAQRKKSG